ncbi:ORF6N domain-containing protein [Alkalihalobacillus trypoxylicola]|uniref:Antirepressor n=1 Tax=Alkalihalobacillus trypoxylicola TaxID=519424 RepID=A0A161PZI4_9BACI|nr:ORF6N domain-containing protein [Alkalihalobacillus trypoxylicola]KYG28145.1 antirepressor [Alkalihalobacillus trypoxylicola]
MNQLAVIEREGQRVLTTSQLSESFGADSKLINRNFQRNSKRFKEGKHFFSLTGSELREFKGSRQNDDSLKFTSVLYLWTEKGAWLHAKSLNTDEAWDAYEMLVDDYYNVKQTELNTSVLSPELQMFKHLFDTVAQKQIEDAERDKKLNRLETHVTTIKETFTEHKDEDWRKSINKMLREAARRTDGDHQGVRRMSYLKLEERARCNLAIRLTNLKDRLEEAGATKTRVKDANKLDVIESDTRLKEIYTTIVKELAIGSLV